jgi:hypothetical protein
MIVRELDGLNRDERQTLYYENDFIYADKSTRIRYVRDDGFLFAVGIPDLVRSELVDVLASRHELNLESYWGSELALGVDLTPPSLVSLAFPASLDLSVSDQNFAFQAVTYDFGGSGVNSVVVWFNRKVAWDI